MRLWTIALCDVMPPRFACTSDFVAYAVHVAVGSAAYASKFIDVRAGDDTAPRHVDLSSSPMSVVKRARTSTLDEVESSLQPINIKYTVLYICLVHTSAKRIRNPNHRPIHYPHACHKSVPNFGTALHARLALVCQLRICGAQQLLKVGK